MARTVEDPSTAPAAPSNAAEADDDQEGPQNNPYLVLALAVGVHFWIMFALTYLGVETVDHIHLNLNRFYMAVAMVAPMVLVMLLFMHHMFTNRSLNVALYALSALVLVAAVVGIRQQLLVGDTQYLRSMIPHHSIAIKTCERADISDVEILELCDQIVQAQREEIRQMEDILDRLG